MNITLRDLIKSFFKIELNKMEIKFKFSIAFVTLVIIIQYVSNNICRG